MIEISSALPAPSTCTPCRFGGSLPGSAECVHCPLNSYPDPQTHQCVECPIGMMAYPGESSCKPRPECVPEYDLVPAYTDCANGLRTASYTLREDSVCDMRNLVIPAARNDSICEVCNPGSYISNNANRCLKCRDGEFSTSTNADKCETCSAGNYAPRTVYYANLEKMPAKFETRCERGIIEPADICALHKGWIVANGSLSVMPHLLVGNKMILKFNMNVTAKRGRLDFLYRVAESAAESLKIRVDGAVTGTLCFKSFR